MTKGTRKTTVLTPALAAALALAYPAAALTADEQLDALKQLPWVGTGTYTLPTSGSKLALPQGDFAVFGADAHRAYRAIGNPTDRAGMEGFVVGGPNLNQLVTFERFDAGYIGLDDWSQLD